MFDRPACPKCGGTDWWFDRTIIPPCESMHYICNCGTPIPCVDPNCQYRDDLEFEKELKEKQKNYNRIQFKTFFDMWYGPGYIGFTLIPAIYIDWDRLRKCFEIEINFLFWSLTFGVGRGYL